MDGFNVIPVEKENNKPAPQTNSSAMSNRSDNFSAGIEIIDEEKEKVKAATDNSKGFLVFILAVFTMIGVLGYFGYLVFARTLMLSQISDYGEKLKELSASIDKNELESYRAMDKTLNAVNSKLSRHIVNSDLISLVNKNIRTNIQVSEYRLEVKEKEVELNLSMISPSFKELAEQSEKILELKDNNQIKSFNVANLSFEQETKKVRFTMRIVFDKTKITSNNQILLQTQ
jgi:hypothetical protein